MAKKRRSYSSRESWFEAGLWLLLVGAGGILFGFGLLGWFEELGLQKWVPVVIGGLITLIAIYLKKYRTETSFALKNRRR